MPRPFRRCRDRLSAHRGRERTRNTKRHSIHRRRRARACDPSLGEFRNDGLSGAGSASPSSANSLLEIAPPSRRRHIEVDRPEVRFPMAMSPGKTHGEEDTRTRARRESPALAEPALIVMALKHPTSITPASVKHQNDRCPIWWWHQPVDATLALRSPGVSIPKALRDRSLSRRNTLPRWAFEDTDKPAFLENCSIHSIFPSRTKYASKTGRARNKSQHHRPFA